MDDIGTNELCRKIGEQGAAEAAEILKMAGQKAASRIEEAESEASGEAEAILKQAERNAEAESKKIASRLQLDLRKMELAAREALIGETMKKVREEIGALRGKREYPDLLARFIVEGALRLGENKIELVVAKEDREILDDSFMKRLSEKIRSAGLSSPSIGISPENLKGCGVIVRGGSGRVEVDNTLEGRISRLNRELRLVISKTLFGSK